MANNLFNLFGALGLDSTLQAIRDRLPLLGFKVTPGGATLIGTAREKFRDEFPDLDNWNIVQDGGMTYGVDGTSQSARYFYVNTGVVNGAEFIMMAKNDDGSPLVFSAPVKAVWAVTSSQAIAGSEFHVELVECDEDGNLITTVDPFASPVFNNSRNAVGVVYDGTSQNNARYKIRAQGVSELTPAAQTFGTSSRTAGGVTPNFTCPYQTEIMLATDMVTIQSRAVNGTSTAATSVVSRSDYVPNPDRFYTLRIRCKNVAVPASSTQFRVHFVRLVDASRVSVDFATVGGNPTDAMAAPVKVINGAITASVSAGTVYPIIAAAAASGVTLTQHKLISAATTNATSVKASAGRIAAGNITNNSASWRYLKLYNKASAPTVGTDVPVQVIGLKPGDNTDLTNLVNVFGMLFATGIAYAITGAAADNDTTAIGASEVIVAIQYI